MLILQAERDSLLKPLQAVTGIVERRHTLPILSNVLIEGGDSQTRLFGNRFGNPNRYLRSGMQCGGFSYYDQCQEISGYFTGTAGRCIGFVGLGRQPPDVEGGQVPFALQTLPAEDFPQMNIGEDVSAVFELEQEAFKSMLHRFNYSMAVQDIRYYLERFADAG